jgi:hypothetical protein
MNKILKNWLLTALTLGLMSGSVVAHEENADASKEPHEAGTHNPDPSDGGGHSSLAGAATNPIANLVQFQIQNIYVPNSYNADSDSNQLILQPVIPIKLSSESVPLLITRTTLAYVNTPDGGAGTKEGFGDLVTQGYFLPKLETKGVTAGVGYNLTIPTAGSNDFTGQGKWSLGPTLVYLNLQTPSWQWGLLSYGSWSFASQDSDRSHVSTISVQPLLTKHFDEGWYARLPEVPATYDFRTDSWQTAWGAAVGKVLNLGKQPVNMFGEIYYNSEDNDDQIQPEWSYKFNVTFLFPS